MERQVAELVHDNGLEAVRLLSAILHGAKQKCSEEEFEALRKGIGLAIGRIQTDVLDLVYGAYPELDDLDQKSPSGSA